MCTAMSLTTSKKELIFGRTMDFSYELDPEVYIVPKNYEWINALNNYKIHNKYKFIGTGQDIGKIIFVDGVNEEGLAIAALYFQDFAYFDAKIEKNFNRISIASIELVNFLLGNCSNIDDVINTIRNIDIIGIEDPITNSVAPLHWMLVDKLGRSITIEKTKKGLEIFNNPLKVLSNSPNFEWHMTNLRNYLNLSPKQQTSVKWEDVILTPFGQGAGTLGLPGDYTSPSRFVRIAFQKSVVLIPETTAEAINLCFNVMKSVMIPKGVVITNRGTYDYTQYTVFMNTDTGDYYFNTHDNNQIMKANINDSNSSQIISLGKLKHPTYFEHI